MIRLNRLPKRVTDFLYPFKEHFRCGQGRHYVIFCWLLAALILDSGKGRLKDLSRIVAVRVRYGAMMCMIRSVWWDPQALVKGWADRVMTGLPAPADGGYCT